MGLTLVTILRLLNADYMGVTLVTTWGLLW